MSLFFLKTVAVLHFIYQGYQITITKYLTLEHWKYFEPLCLE